MRRPRTFGFSLLHAMRRERTTNCDRTRRRLLLGLIAASSAIPARSVFADRSPRVGSAGARVVGSGSDLAAAADDAGEGTVFLLEPGIYRASVAPKSGQTFIGGPDVVLDGGMRLPMAFQPTADDVTLQELVVRNYANGRQQGAINGDKRFGWRILDCDVTGSRNLGINLGPGMLVQGGRVHHNGYLGLGGGQAHGARVAGVEIDHNGLALDDPDDAFWEAGGLKLAVSVDCVLENNRVHHNGSVGLWLDEDCARIICRNNVIWENADPGISYEISSDGLIEDNVVSRNGTLDRGWLWSGQIQIYNSRNVVVRRNRIEIAADFGNGVTLIEHDRVRPDGFEYETRDNVIEGNTIIHLGADGISGMVTEPERHVRPQSNRWRENEWIVPAPGVTVLDLNGADLTWSQANRNGLISGGRQVLEGRLPFRL